MALSALLPPLSMGEIGSVIPPLDPSYKGEDLVNGLEAQGQDDVQ
jgi:hypothetical protein